MRVEITPSRAVGTVMAPPSKSMAHRILIGAGLAEGTSVIENIDLSEDIRATLGILKALGAEYKITDDCVIMQGIGNKPIEANSDLDSNESGSTLRFFIPIVLTGGKKYEFVGARRLFERPLGIYEDICREQGIFFEKSEEGLLVQGQLKASHYKVAGNISSQFITGLLFALPLLAEDSVLEVIPPIESKAYIDMTLDVLFQYGIEVRADNYKYYVRGNQKYQAKDMKVEGDYSNAAFLEAFHLIGGDVRVTGLEEESLQGDRVYRTYFEELRRGEAILDISECPDLGPILMGMAAATGKGARFTGTRRLQIKESDRGKVMAEELSKFGIRVDVEDNEITVYPGDLQTPQVPLQSHNDHRIAMTMAVLCTITGGTIEGAQSVKKSFPRFYEVIGTLGIQIARTE